MKWTPIILLMMSGLVSANIVGGMLPVSGGAATGGNYAVVCGPPVYDYFTGCSNPPTYVLITWPLNKSSLFWSPPSITENTTVDSSEGVASTYEYRIEAGLWNSFTHTGNTVNGTWDMVTYPEGYPITLYVNVSNSCGWVVNSSTIFVYGRPSPFATGNDSMPIVFGVLLLVFVFIVGFTLKDKPSSSYPQSPGGR